MCAKQPRSRETESHTTNYSRRHVLAIGAGTSAMLLAGCSTETSGGDTDDPSSGDAEDGASTAGMFRLLISDQPVAIDDFEELNVSLDRARIFSEDAEQDEESEDEQENETEVEEENEAEDEQENETEAEEENETEAEEENESENEEESETEDEQENETEAEEENEAEDEEDDDGRGFQVIDLDDATVDLTQLVGDKATSVFEGNLEEGRYTKIELYAADVEGIVEGETVDVMIPSGKLQIVKPFEITAGETVSFVFDINVVKKGQQQEYNLLPVISESGVAGQDVEAEEIEGGPRESEQDDDSTAERGDSEETESAEEPTDNEEQNESERA